MTENERQKAAVPMTWAEKALKSAKVLLETEDFRASINRCYYAMFYAASAALASRGIECKTHSGVLHQFNKILVKDGTVHEEHARFLDKAFAIRQDADYHYLAKIERKDAEQQLADAEKFVANVKKVIKKEGEENNGRETAG